MRRIDWANMRVAGCKYLKRFMTCNFICHKKDGGYSKIGSYSSVIYLKNCKVEFGEGGLVNRNAELKCHAQ